MAHGSKSNWMESILSQHYCTYLIRENLSEDFLTGLNLQGSNLTGTHLTEACLLGNAITEANLKGANLTAFFVMKYFEFRI